MKHIHHFERLLSVALMVLLVLAATWTAGLAQTGETLEERTLYLEAQPLAGQLPSAARPPLDSEGTDYRIGRQDLLEVRVFDVEELNQTVRVADDGSITMPLLGRLSVAGLTKTELEMTIAALLEERFVRNPQVTIFVKEFESKKVAVSGAVKKPGSYEMLGRKTLLEMLSLAGGLDKDLSKEIIVFRKDPAGDNERISVDLNRLVYEADPSLNVSIQPGDIIYVPTVEKIRIFVSGAVKNPNLYEVPRDEPVTVLEAITLAGGTTDRAAEKRVQIIRENEQGIRETLYVNLRRVKSGKAEDPVLHRGDLVLVPESFFLMIDQHDKHDRLDLFAYWPVIVRRRWAIYIAVAAAGLFALVGSFLMTPLYQATATLQIERQNPDVLSVRDVARTDYAWSAYEDFYQTQYRIIASEPVAREAVELSELTSHPEFAGPFEQSWWSRLKSLIPRKPGPDIQVDEEARIAMMVQAGLQVAPIRNSQLVTVSWTHADPELAAKVANSVADSYIRVNLRAQYDTGDQAQEFLQEQAVTLQDDIRTAEETLHRYGRDKNILSIDDTKNLTLQSLQRVSEEFTRAETERVRAEARYASVVDAPPEALPEVMNSTLIGRLRAEYAALEAKHGEQSKMFKDDWPPLQNLASKMEQSRERLELETERIARQVVSSSEAALQKARDESVNLGGLLRAREREAQALKGDAIEFASQQSAVEKKRETLESLLKRQNEMLLSTQLSSEVNLDNKFSNVRVVEKAKVPPAPFRPNTRLNLMLGLLLGLAFGVGLAFFLEQVDNTIGSPTELEGMLSIPLLAVIPRHGKGGSSKPRARRRPELAAADSVDLIAHRDNRSFVAEAYRGLRTSILLSNPGRPPRQIVLSSAAPEEGKTATAINLAVVLAQLGRRVLIVDADLRRPRLHKAFATDASRGVSTYLSGMADDPTQLVQKTAIDLLDFMPSGPVPPNPSELLNSPVFARMGTELLESGYDHIIFDSPPVLSVSDPVIIASVVDTGILVVRAGRTPRQSVRMAAERLAQAGTGPFGVVLNDFDSSSQGTRYDRYHYYGSYEEPESAEGAKGNKPGKQKVRHASGGA